MGPGGTLSAGNTGVQLVDATMRSQFDKVGSGYGSDPYGTCGGCTWSGAYGYGRVSAVMLYPLWIPMLLIPAGLLLMAVSMLADFVRQVRLSLGPLEGRDEAPPPDRRA